MVPTRLDHCVIHVSDWERSNAFYTTVLGAELVARAAFDQPRSEPALDWRRDMRTAGLGPDQSKLASIAFLDNFPIQGNGSGIVRERAVFGGVGCDFVQDHREYHGEPRRERDSAERNIPGMDDLERAVVLPQAQRTVRLEPLEAAGYRFIATAMDCELAP